MNFPLNRRMLFSLLVLVVALFAQSYLRPERSVRAEGASTPGGVSSNLSLWLKADAGPFVGKGSPPTDGNPVTGWMDASPNGHVAFQLTSDLQPIFTDEQINFNPVLEFTGDQHLENSSLPRLDQNDYALFLVTEQLTPSAWAGYLSMNVGGNTGQPALTEISTLSTIGMNAIDQTWPPDYSVPIPAQPFIIHNISVSGTVEIASSDGDVSSGPYSWTPTGTALGYFVGRHGAFPSQTLNGRIAEAVVYDSSLTADERNRVESYLAVKYGVTLLGSKGGISYTSADGTTIWDALSNASYHHDVAGIGRDDASALNQQRSRSINSDALVLMDNGGAFGADGSFLLWGNNDATTVYTVTAGSHLHMGRIWRTSETGTVGTVTLSVPSSSAAVNLLVDSDTDFSDATVFPLTDDGAGNLSASVDFTDGQFFTFGQPGGPTTAPGGVSPNLSLWLRADAGLTTSGGNASQWLDQSPAAYLAEQGNKTSQPLVVTDTINFNPALRFDGQDDEMTIAGGILGTATYGDINAYVVARTHAIQESFVFRESTTGGSSVSRISLHLPYSNEIAYYDIGDDSTGRISSPWGGQVGTPYVWGLLSSTNSTALGHNQDIVRDGMPLANDDSAIPVTGVGADFGIGYGQFEGQYYDADISELILYDGPLTLTQHMHIQSYLAVKYGVTLGTSAAPVDYLSADGTVIWDGVETPEYHHDVAGIGRDDASALDQRRSRSINSGAPVMMDNGGAFSADSSFLLWGDNGATTAYTVAAGPHLHMGRIWRTREMGTVGSVTLSIPSSTAAISLLSDNDPDFSDATVFPLTDDGAGNLTVTIDFPDGNWMFTFAGAAPTAVTLDSLNSPVRVPLAESLALLLVMGLLVCGLLRTRTR